jgi:hypothetical protein
MDGTGRVAQTLIKTMLPGSRQDALKAKHDTWLRCFLIHFHRPLDAGFKGTSIVSSRWGSSLNPTESTSNGPVAHTEAIPVLQPRF